MYCLYKHINKINGKIYIGQTKQNPPEKRWGENGRCYTYKRKEKFDQPLFAKAILKYGWNNFEHIIISTNLTKEQADWAETQLIIFYQSNNPKYGYNSQIGGNNHRPNDETKKKSSESHKGKKLSEETRKKMSENHKGKPHQISKESRKLIGETIKKLMQNPDNYKKRIDAMAKANSIKIYCPTNNQYYESCEDAAKQLNLTASIISRIINGKLKITKGYTFRKVEN